MKAGKRRDFLESRSFDAGQFETEQLLLDRSIGQLSDVLLEPVDRTLRAQLTLEVADADVSSVQLILDKLLKASRPTQEMREFARNDLLRSLAQQLQGALNESDIEQEVRLCAHEIAELVLSRWFERLNLAIRTADKARLNANLLPDTQSLEETLSGVDFESHGIAKLVVVNAVRTYWKSLIDDALRNSQPIQLGNHLWIVPDRYGSNQPHLLFKSAVQARMHAKNSIVRTDPVLQGIEEVRKDEFLKLYRSLVGTLGNGRVPTEGEIRLALNILLISSKDKQTNGLVDWNLPEFACLLYGDRQKPIGELAESVGRGVDLVVAALAGGEHQPAEALLRTEPEIEDVFSEYAKVNAVPVKAVEDAYSLAVCVGVEYQPMRRTSLLSTTLGQPEWEFDAHARFAERYRVAAHEAVRLLSTTFLGSALATPGIARIW